jgi:hypothetical protein
VLLSVSLRVLLGDITRAPTTGGYFYEASGDRNAPAENELTHRWRMGRRFENARATLRFILHISGSDNGLTATYDSPDQLGFGRAVDSISFRGSTLTFEISRINVRFTGDLLDDGTIGGELVQRGVGVPLVLARSSGAAPPASGSVENGRYHNDQTGLEFELPPGFSLRDTANYINNNGWQATITDSQRSNALVAAVWMAKRSLPEKRIPSILDGEIPAKIARRTDPNHPYEIPADSIQKISINGRPAISAIGRYQQTDGQKMAELLTWIVTEHTEVHFYAMVPVDILPDVQWRFDQMVQSAMVP